VPNRYRDAKFGIWAHWGPESAPEFGDWYAQRMYIEGNPTYKYHLENCGHPSKFGYKDICREVWKGNKFDPDSLMAPLQEGWGQPLRHPAAPSVE